MSGARASDLVAVFGIGGLGHLVVQYAKIAGAMVVAVDNSEEKLNLAQELGADHVVNALEQDPVAAIKKLGGADAAIDTAVSMEATEQVYGCLRRGGTLGVVGLPKDGYVNLPIFGTVLNGVTVKGSIVGTRVDLKEVFELDESRERPKGYRFPKAVISYAVYLYTASCSRSATYKNSCSSGTSTSVTKQSALGAPSSVPTWLRRCPS